MNKEDVIVGERGEIGAARYVLPYEFVGVFDQTFLPGQQLCNNSVFDGANYNMQIDRYTERLHRGFVEGTCAMNLLY